MKPEMKREAQQAMSESDYLDQLEDMARQHCFTSEAKHEDFQGQVRGTLVTDSGAISSNAETLRLLAGHNRFRIVAEYNRMVVGYWPENDPTLPVSKNKNARS